MLSREKQELSQLMNKEYKCVALAAARVVDRNAYAHSYSRSVSIICSLRVSLRLGVTAGHDGFALVSAYDVARLRVSSDAARVSPLRPAC